MIKPPHSNAKPNAPPIRPSTKKSGQPWQHPNRPPVTMFASLSNSTPKRNPKFLVGFLPALPHLFGYGLRVGRVAAAGRAPQRSPSVRECSHREFTLAAESFLGTSLWRVRQKHIRRIREDARQQILQRVVHSLCHHAGPRNPPIDCQAASSLGRQRCACRHRADNIGCADAGTCLGSWSGPP